MAAAGGGGGPPPPPGPAPPGGGGGPAPPPGGGGGPAPPPGGGAGGPAPPPGGGAGGPAPPPGGGAGGPAPPPGGGGGPAPPPAPPGGGGGPPPPGPAPAPGMNVLMQQFVAALRAAVPAPAPVPPRQQRKLPPPVFKGGDGEDPEVHLLRANDWMDAYDVLPADRIREFRHTLDDLARQWYDDIALPANWDDLQTAFTRYFSLHGRNAKQVYEAWSSLTFTPGDNIDAFIRRVKMIARRGDFNEQMQLSRIKSLLPESVYGAFYNVNDMPTMCAMLRDMYAPPVRSADPAGLSRMKAVSGTTETKGTPEVEIERLARMTDDNKPKKNFKPFITKPRERRGKGKGFYQPRDDGYQDRKQFRRDFRPRYDRRGFKPRRGRGGRQFDRSPTKRKPRIASRTINKDKDRCHYCHEFGHWERDCQRKHADQKKKAAQKASNKTYEDMSQDYQAPQGEYTSMAATAPMNPYLSGLRHMDYCQEATLMSLN